MLALPFLITAISLTVRVTALNDWSVPCTDGSCSFDWVGDHSTKAFSSLAIDGSRSVLSDITQAAGWKVWKCNPDWEDGEHSVLMVCDGTAAQVELCNHVYASGAENMVVRLPQNCAKGPFARIKSTFEPANETIPEATRAQMIRDPSTVAVRGLVLDFDFSSVPQSKGKLNFAITSSNAAHPVISRRHTDHYKRGRAKALQQRGFFDDIGDKVKGAFSDATSAVTSVATKAADKVEDVATKVADKVEDVATKAADKVEDVATKAADKVEDVATKVADKVESVATKAATAVVSAGKAIATGVGEVVDDVRNATSFNETKNNGNVPLKFDRNFTLLDTDINCVSFKNQFNAHIHLDVDAHMDANIKYGYTLVGSIVPFEVKDMSVSATLTGIANTTFNLGLEATGKLDTFPIELFKFGLPGLSIPGIGALGPELVLETRMKMDLEVAAQMQVNANFDFGEINMVFPEDKGGSKANSKPAENKNSVQLSTANGGTDFSGKVEALIIPRFDFGIDLKVVQASVFLEMEAGAVMEIAGSSGIGGGAAERAATEAAAEEGTTEEDATEENAAEEDATEEDAAAEDGTAVEDDSTAEDDTLARRALPEDVEETTGETATEDETAVEGDAEAEVEDDTAAEEADSTTTAEEEGDPSLEDSTEDDTAVEDGTAAEDDTAVEGDTAAEGDVEEAAAEDDTAAEEDAETEVEDDTAAEQADNSAAADPEADAPVSKDLGGCVQVNAVMSISYGLRGTIFPLFPKALKFPLFSTEKELIQKCFGGATPDILEKAKEAAASDEETLDEEGTSDEEATDEEGTSDEEATDEEATSDEATSDEATEAVEARSLSIRRRYATLQRRQSLGEIAAAAVPQLGGAALSLLVCPSSGLTALAAFSSVIGAPIF